MDTLNVIPSLLGRKWLNLFPTRHIVVLAFCTADGAQHAAKARVERMKRMETGKIAPLAAYLMADQSKDVSGQIFAVRANEIFLFNHNRPIRSVHRAEGWTPESVAEHAMPSLKAGFASLDRSADVFCWDPI